MDPEKDLLDIPTELEIPIEEEKNEVAEVQNDSLLVEAVNDNNSAGVESNNVEIDQVVDNNSNSVEAVPEELSVNSNLDESPVVENNNEQIADTLVAPDMVQPTLEEQSSLNVDSINNIEQPVLENNNDVLNTSTLNESSISPTVDTVSNTAQPVQEVQNPLNFEVSTNNQSEQVEVQQPSLVIEPALSSDGLSSPIVNSVEMVDNQQLVPVSNQTVPTIQPLDSTNPPEELQITVDKDTKIKKNPKRKKKFNPIWLIIILLVIGLGCTAYFLLPKYLNKKTPTNSKTSSLYVLQVDFKDSIDSAYSFLKIQDQETVTGTYGTYSIENDILTVTKSDGNKYTVSFDGLYFSNVKYFGNLNNKDYLKLSDDFNNNYIYAIGEISDNQTVQFSDENLLMIPTTVSADSVEIGSYQDRRGPFFAVRNGDSISLIVKKDSKSSLERLTGSIINGQDVSIADLDINKDLLDKVSVNGFIFEYTGGISVYSKTDDDTSVYPLNDVEEKSYVAKTVYLVVNNEEKKIELYIFFDKDSKEYLNVVNLTDSDFANGNENLSDYSSPIKSKELSNEKILITFEDGSKIEK